MNLDKVTLLSEQANELINSNDPIKQAEGRGILNTLHQFSDEISTEMLKKLGIFCCEHDHQDRQISLGEQLGALVMAYSEELNEGVMYHQSGRADHVELVQVVELYEFDFSVQQLLREIGFIRN